MGTMDISSSSMAKLGRDETVRSEMLIKNCVSFRVDFGYIVKIDAGE